MLQLAPVPCKIPGSI